MIEGKPDVDPVDLRMLNPFPQLVDLVKKVDLNAMDDAQHAHVPYVRYDYCFLTTFQKKNRVEKSNDFSI